MANTILIRGQAEEEGGLIASEALEPGQLVEFGGSDDIQKHSSAGENALPMFVREQWENEGAGIDDTIASGDEATVLYPVQGSKINAWLDNTSGNASKGDPLESVGNGNLRVVATDADTSQAERDSVVAYADEAVTSPGSDEVRIRVTVA